MKSIVRGTMEDSIQTYQRKKAGKFYGTLQQ